jgi:hypothetical protein
MLDVRAIWHGIADANGKAQAWPAIPNCGRSLLRLLARAGQHGTQGGLERERRRKQTLERVRRPGKAGPPPPPGGLNPIRTSGVGAIVHRSLHSNQY